MNGSEHRRTLVIALCCIALLSASIAVAADPPVTATFATTGTAKPGASVTTKATIKINDGSTLQSLKWSQIGGVTATLANTTTDSVGVTLPALAAFRDKVIAVMEDRPITESQIPPYFPKRDYHSGLQNRWGIAGLAPTTLSKAGAVNLELSVVTSSGSYKFAATVTATLPYPTATGLRNVPLGRPVLLQGKEQASYNWAMKSPTGSTAALDAATTAYPEFTPDVAGTYEITVNDLATNKPVTLTVHAGKWTGVVAGKDADGNPTADAACTSCHVKNTPTFDQFTPWAKTGHARIFSDNVVNTAPDAHYTESCVSCHTVGYDKNANNGGFDDAPNYQAFLDSGMLTHGAADNWNKILSQFPGVAKLANIQCENCHGPQDSAAHMKKDGSRKTIASEVCATCHGRAPRHGRYQQWQLSGHGNYQLAVDEGTDPSCGKCHSGQGFIEWSKKNFSTANLTVTWTTDEVHPQTCVTCHDPHNVGTSSKEGHLETDAPMRLHGDTPLLLSGFTAKNVGNAAICMTCHNGRRGIRNDTNFNIADATRAPHVGPQTDVLMGQNMYFVPTGNAGFHSMIEDSCVVCHMERTEAPSQLYSPEVGTNHTFFANPDICTKCHTNITLEAVQGPIEAKMESLKHEIETAIRTLMIGQIRLGNQIDIGGTKVKAATDIKSVEFIESHGRQGVSVKLADGREIADVSLASVKVVPPAGTAVDLYSLADPALGKAGWNYFMAHSDKSKGVHNPGFVTAALDVALFAVKNVNAVATSGGVGVGAVPASVGGGIGNGTGAVSCTTPYVYWTEIAGHMPGNAGSQWRTDLITRNLGSKNAALKFILHQATGNLEGTATVAGLSQKGFEDIVATLGSTNAFGSLEICSDQPLLVLGRVFNEATGGTFGQNVDGHVANLGYNAGQTASLIGLRQKAGLYRSNIIVMNGGKDEAEISVKLFDADGIELTTYTLKIPAGQVLNDTEPFANRANKPDLGWGFATLTVVKGTNIRTIGSLVDSRTNDPTTLPAKQ